MEHLEMGCLFYWVKMFILPITHCSINLLFIFISILVLQIPSLVIMFWKKNSSLYHKSFLKHFPKINTQNHVISTIFLKVNWVVRLNDLGINITKLKIALWERGRKRDGEGEGELEREQNETNKMQTQIKRF